MQVEHADISSPQKNGSLFDIPEPGQKAGNGDLSVAGWSDQDSHVVFRHSRRHIFQDVPLAVAEADIFEFDCRAIGFFENIRPPAVI